MREKSGGGIDKFRVRTFTTQPKRVETGNGEEE